MLNMKVVVRFVSGREEQYEMDFLGGGSAEHRLREFAKDPSLLLQIGDEVVIIPTSAIECITLKLPEADERIADLPNVRKAVRSK